MNDTEKTARILRVIAYLLCAIFIMQVILFAGITAFAGGENLLDYSQFHLNTRIRQVGELGVQNGISVTNIIDVYQQTRIYFYDLNNFVELQSNFNVFAMSSNADMSGSVGYLWLDYFHQVDDHVSYIEFPVSTYEYRYFRINYIPQYPLTTITSTSEWTLKANFTGEFIESIDSYSPIDFLSAFADKIDDLSIPLVDSFYVNGDFTIYGKILFTLCGVGIGCAIIKLILHLFGGKK